MTMHNDGEDDWFLDEDDVVPWWRIALSWIAIAALLGVCLALVYRDANAVPNRSPQVEQDDQNEVRIGVMCGDLQGSGAVVIVDPPQGKVYKFDFTCPTGKSI